MEREIEELYQAFKVLTIKDLEQILLESDTREKRAFFRTLLNMKLAIEQEKIIGEKLM